MESAGFEEVPFDGLRGGRHFPLGLVRQAGASPARVRVSFVIADVTDGFVEIERLNARGGENADRSVRARFELPVERRVPSLGVQGVPSVGQPKLGARISTVAHELEILSVGN